MAFGWFKRREVSLRDKLNETKNIKVSGVLFKIKRIQVLDYMEGARVLHETFSVYKTKEQKVLDEKLIKNLSKAKEYMRDVIMAGVVQPKLVRKQEDDPSAVCVDELVEGDWMMAQNLAAEILAYTYGKKK